MTSPYQDPRPPIKWTVEDVTSDFEDYIEKPFCNEDERDTCIDGGPIAFCTGHFKDEDRVYWIRGPSYESLEEAGLFWSKKDADLVIEAIKIAAEVERNERPLHVIDTYTGKVTRVPEMNAEEVLEASRINRRLLRAARAVLEEFRDGDVSIHCDSLEMLKSAVDVADVGPAC